MTWENYSSILILLIFSPLFQLKQKKELWKQIDSVIEKA